MRMRMTWTGVEGRKHVRFKVRSLGWGRGFNVLDTYLDEFVSQEDLTRS